jgi:hypothetical protein
VSRGSGEGRGLFGRMRRLDTSAAGSARRGPDAAGPAGQGDTVSVSEYADLVLLQSGVGSPGGTEDLGGLARLLAAEKAAYGVATVLVRVEDLGIEFWTRLSAVLDNLGDQGTRTVRLVLPGAGSGHPDEPALAQEIADAWGFEVIAPEAEVLIVPGGWLFVPDHAAPDRGWRLFLPDSESRPLGPRSPSPPWQPTLARLPENTAGGCLVEQIPAGVLVRPAGTSPQGSDRCYTAPVDARHPVILVGTPEPGAADVPSTDLAALLAALPEEIRAVTRLASDGAHDVLGLGQDTADILGEEVEVLTGLPLLVDTTISAAISADRTPEIRPVLIGANSEPTWRPFAESVACRPSGGSHGATAPPPRLLRWRSPVAHDGHTEQGVVPLSDEWQVSVTRSGLAVRPRGDTPSVAERPVSAERMVIDVGFADEAADESLYPDLSQLLASLDADMRKYVALLPSRQTDDEGLRLLRLAIQHGVKVMEPPGDAPPTAAARRARPVSVPPQMDDVLIASESRPPTGPLSPTPDDVAAHGPGIGPAAPPTEAGSPTPVNASAYGSKIKDGRALTDTATPSLVDSADVAAYQPRLLPPPATTPPSENAPTSNPADTGQPTTDGRRLADTIAEGTPPSPVTPATSLGARTDRPLSKRATLSRAMPAARLSALNRPMGGVRSVEPATSAAKHPASPSPAVSSRKDARHRRGRRNSGTTAGEGVRPETTLDRPAEGIPEDPALPATRPATGKPEHANEPVSDRQSGFDSGGSARGSLRRRQWTTPPVSDRPDGEAGKDEDDARPPAGGLRRATMTVVLLAAPALLSGVAVAEFHKHRNGTADRAPNAAGAPGQPVQRQSPSAIPLQSNAPTKKTPPSTRTTKVAKTGTTHKPTGPAPLGFWRIGSGAGPLGRDETKAFPATVHDIARGSGHGGCGIFNGKDSQLTTVGPALSTGPDASFTVSAWVYLTSTSDFATAVSQDNGANDSSAFYLQYSAPDKRWSFARKARALSSAAPALRTWTHLVGVYQARSGQLTLYLNGTQQGTAHSPSPVASTGPLVIGRAEFHGKNTDWFPGQINDVKVFTTALTDDQIKKL